MTRALLCIGLPVVLVGAVVIYEFWLPLYHPDKCNCRRCKWRGGTG